MGQFFIPRSRIRCVLPIKADTGKGCQAIHLYQHENSEHLLHIAAEREDLNLNHLHLVMRD